MHKGHIQNGIVTGTGAAINVSLGFIPTRVTLVNIANATTLDWQDTMPAAAGVKTIAVGTQSVILTLGVSTFPGVAGVSGAGFTIGADASLNIATNVIHWIAICSDS